MLRPAEEAVEAPGDDLDDSFALVGFNTQAALRGSVSFINNPKKKPLKSQAMIWKGNTCARGVRVCVSACVCVRVRVCVRACVRACLCARALVRAHVLACVRVRVCVRACVRACLHSFIIY